ncbi:MAG TPA: CoA transferase [Aliidongia sp.]|uniref:CaiB/BaiF CoA transferase family protein n=1 Tax=Aliidongia sp. TaxID=1914230 RepID=UPI002DDCC810|nr:CoA transferase [Aliidongia sp.]HEV2676736.1 CoA transferase [Aliidongia sp.]
MFKPLAGLRVLDFTKVLAGPLCTQYLSDMGAEVIKVEPAEVGDETRRWPPFREGQGAVFLSVNRNKQSLAVDLKTAAGREIVHRLMPTIDIVVESYGTGVTERLAIDYATLKALKPDLIYCSISGFGRTGPRAGSLGYDVILQAFSGVMSLTGEKGGGPIRSPISPIDQTTGLHAFSGILAALLQRGSTGEGTQLEVSLFETAVGFLGYNLQSFWEKGVQPEKCGSGHESLCPYQAFEASDAPLMIGIANDNLWQRFCRAVGREDLIDDPRFRTNPDRVAHFAETVATVQAIVQTRPRDEWTALLTGLGVPCAPINSLQEMLDDPHTAARGIVLDYDHPTLGPMKSIAHPIVFNGAERSVRTAPPLHGEHTRRILAAAGYDADRIEELVAGAVIVG